MTLRIIFGKVTFHHSAHSEQDNNEDLKEGRAMEVLELILVPGFSAQRAEVHIAAR
ncbi:MAG: hypothetical protein WD158_01940 [Balneolaceae bacterium]